MFEDVRVRENFVERSGRIYDWFQLQLWDLLFNGENGNNLSYTGTEIIRTYFHVVRLRSHEIRLNDDIYRYFRVSLSITSEA